MQLQYSQNKIQHQFFIYLPTQLSSIVSITHSMLSHPRSLLVATIKIFVGFSVSCCWNLLWPPMFRVWAIYTVFKIAVAFFDILSVVAFVYICCLDAGIFYDRRCLGFFENIVFAWVPLTRIRKEQIAFSIELKHSRN